MKQSYLFERFCHIKTDAQVNFADVWDRLAAFVLDLVFLVLLTNLVFAPVKKKLQVAILNEHDGAAQVYFWLMVVGFAVLFLSYHTLCIFFYKRTLGKKIFGIEVQSVLGDKDLSLGNCFLRSMTQLFSLVLCGFPFLQVFSHKMRRPLHDRASDTITCSLKKKGKVPDFIEKLWVKVVYATVVVNLVIVLFVQLYFIKSDLNSLTEFVAEPDYVCDDVSEAKDFWPDQNRASRLDVALAMFGAGEIGKECLEVEAQKYISFEQDLDKAYLAEAFANEDRSQISNEYLKKVCEESDESDACLLTKMIGAWSEKKWSAVDALLEDHPKIFSPFLTVWAIQHFERKQDYQKVLKLTEGLVPNRALSNFIGKYKAKHFGT